MAPNPLAGLQLPQEPAGRDEPQFPPETRRAGPLLVPRDRAGPGPTTAIAGSRIGPHFQALAVNTARIVPAKAVTCNLQPDGSDDISAPKPHG